LAQFVPAIDTWTWFSWMRRLPLKNTWALSTGKRKPGPAPGFLLFANAGARIFGKCPDQDVRTCTSVNASDGDFGQAVKAR
jgi:hypothetical protein